MLTYHIPGFARVRARRLRQFLRYLEEDGWADTEEYRALHARQGHTFTDELTIERLMLDLNGTLAVGGKILHGVVESLRRLQAAGVELLLVTGDGRGTAEEVRQQFRADGVELQLVATGKKAGTGYVKLQRVLEAGADTTVFIGNGGGDALALRAAVLSIAVTQGELLSVAAMSGAVGHATDVCHALEALLSFEVLRATFHE